MLTHHWKGYDDGLVLKRLWWWVTGKCSHWKAFDVDGSLKRLCWWVTKKALMMGQYWKGYNIESLKRLWCWWVTKKAIMRWDDSDPWVRVHDPWVASQGARLGWVSPRLQPSHHHGNGCSVEHRHVMTNNVGDNQKVSPPEITMDSSWALKRSTGEPTIQRKRKQS
jgi:hypothetical protein